jgi:hypothetical protein
LRIVFLQNDINNPSITKRGEVEDLLVGSKANYDLSTNRIAFDDDVRFLFAALE